MAAYSSTLQRFYTVCRLGTGFSQEQLKRMYDEVKTFNVDSLDPDSQVRRIYTCN